MKITEQELEIIENLLPHGSGINGTWQLTLLKNGKVLASNCFDAMNEVGMYCHYYDFTLTIEHIPTQGKYIIIPGKYEITRLNFHGQKENACCGYGLKDYIFETCDYALE